MKKSFFSILLILALVFTMALSGCEEKAEKGKEKTGDGATLETAEVTHYAVIEIENFGVITAELYGKTAPVTVNNFVSLANSGYYTGLKFHRIIDGFMMQGGAGAKKDSIKGEFASNGVTNNLKHEAGVLSMARTNQPDSASTQFFIMHEAAPHLDGQYAAFGKVISGMDIVDRICRTAVVSDGNGSVPAQYQPVIKSVTILPGDTKDIFTENTLKPTDKPIEVPVATEPVETEPAEIMGDGDGATLETAVATHYVTIEIANYGTIKAELYGNTAPISVENFVSLAESGFYDGLTFHRIIAGFMMQGGAPKADSPEVMPIVGEFEANGITNNLQHQKGVLSMARTSVKDSATSQFFIMHEYAPHLDGQYAAFGLVIEGIEVVDAVCESAQPTDGNGSIAPADQPVITSITVETVN